MIIRSGIPKPSAFVHTRDVGFPAQATNENLVFWSRDSHLATLLTCVGKERRLESFAAYRPPRILSCVDKGKSVHENSYIPHFFLPLVNQIIIHRQFFCHLFIPLQNFLPVKLNF